jgi:cell division protein ZapA (FtsZ GTPase activity inhibitor)
MGQVTITLNSRTYRLSCNDGEEARLIQLADELRSRVDNIIAEYGHAGDDRLLLMAALLALDELFDLKARLAELVPVEQPSGMIDPVGQPPGGDPGPQSYGTYVAAPAEALPPYAPLAPDPPGYGAARPEQGSVLPGGTVRPRARAR